MKNLFFIFSIITLLTSCSTYDPEGIWQKDADPNQQLLFLKTDGKLFVRRPGMRQYDELRSEGKNVFKSIGVDQTFKFKSKDHLEVVMTSTSNYTRVIPEKVNPNVITQGMTKEQVIKFIGQADEQYEEAGYEKWLYNNNITQHSVLLIFQSDKVVDMNSSYKKDRDLSLIRADMSYKEVVAILGMPDEFRADQTSKTEYQKWYYGKNSAVVFENKVVIDIEHDINQKIVDLSNMFSNSEQTYQLVDLFNDKPAAFVIEDQHTELLDCECALNNGSPTIKLKGEYSDVGIALQGDRKYTFLSSYKTMKGNKSVSLNPDKFELKLNSMNFSKGKSVIGFIRLEDNCITEPNGSKFPCYFKGTFECVFK